MTNKIERVKSIHDELKTMIDFLLTEPEAPLMFFICALSLMGCYGATALAWNLLAK